MEKVETKCIYVNKQLEKRMNDKDKVAKKAYRDKENKDPIAHAAKEGNKSPRVIFKESMQKFNRLMMIPPKHKEL